jgi:hypothetical protein
MHNGSAATQSLVHDRAHCSAALSGFFGDEFCACAADATQSITRTAITLVMAAPRRERYARLITFSTGRARFE